MERANSNEKPVELTMNELRDDELNQVAGGWTSWTRHSTPGYGTPHGGNNGYFYTVSHT
jgi:bacteriocin-like protein